MPTLTYDADNYFTLQCDDGTVISCMTPDMLQEPARNDAGEIIKNSYKLEAEKVLSKKDIVSLSLAMAKIITSQRINAEHARILRLATGNATIEERDTWTTKAQAAQAVLADNASDEQKNMLALEATVTGETVEELATTIIDRLHQYEKFIGHAAGIKRKAIDDIKTAAKEDDIEKIVTAFNQKIEELLTHA